MSPSLQRIRWRLIWTSFLALALSLGSFYLYQWTYAYSDDQCTWAVETDEATVGAGHKPHQRVVIREVLPDGMAEEAGLLEGDELLAIQGHKVTPDTLQQVQQYINTQPETRVLMYTTRRNGRILHQPVGLVKSFQMRRLILLITGLVAWAIGLLVVVSSPQRKIARHFYLLCVLTLMLPVTVDTFTSTLPAVFQIPIWLASALVMGLWPALWLHFFLRFPYPFELRKNRRFLSILYCVFLTFPLFGLLFRVARLLGIAEVADPLLKILGTRWFGLLVATLYSTAIIWGTVRFWRGTFKLGYRMRRGLLPALIFTTAILVDVAAYTVLAVRNGTSLVFARESWVFFLPLPLLPLSFAYAIFRHGFFDVRRALLRWITYFGVLGAILVAYIAGLAWIFTQSLTALPPAWVGGLMALAALPIGWLLRAMLVALRRKFRRDLNSARELIMGGLREPRKRFSEDALLKGLADSLREAFRPQVLLLLPLDGGRIQLPALESLDGLGDAAKVPHVLCVPSAILRHARDDRELVLGLGSDEADWIREEGEELRAHMDALGAQVMVLILAGEKPCAAILLGGKYAELNYGREDRELLREVAMAAGSLLEAAAMHRRLLDQGRLEQELQTARHIQEGLITSVSPEIPGFQLALRLDPALETGGDLLWVRRRPSGHWIGAVGDVSGKGLAAALYMSQATALLEYAIQKEGTDFSDILPALDAALRSLMSHRDFLTLCLVEWDETGRFRLARAGHPAPLLVRGAHDGEVEELAIHGRGLGLRPCGASDWQIHEGVLEPGQWLALYSDGLTEGMDRHGELFGVSRLRRELQHFWVMGSVRAACEAVFREVASFNEQNRDDRTLFILGREHHEPTR